MYPCTYMFVVDRLLLRREPLWMISLLMTTFVEKLLVDCEMGVGRKAGDRLGGFTRLVCNTMNILCCTVLYCFILLRDCIVIG